MGRGSLGDADADVILLGDIEVWKGESITGG